MPFFSLQRIPRTSSNASPFKNFETHLPGSNTLTVNPTTAGFILSGGAVKHSSPELLNPFPPPVAIANTATSGIVSVLWAGFRARFCTISLTAPSEA